MSQCAPCLVQLARRNIDLKLNEKFIKPFLTEKSARKEFILKNIKSLKADWIIEQDVCYKENQIELENIIVTLNPNASKRIVLTAHSQLSTSNAPDLAIPMLLHIVGILDELLVVQKDLNPDLTLQLVFFDSYRKENEAVFGSRFRRF